MCDFNARTDIMQPNHLATRPRRNQDVEKNRHGLQLLELCCETDAVIINGTTQGDVLGNYTYSSSLGHSTIDYAIASASDLPMIHDFFVNPHNYLSRHAPITICIKMSMPHSNGLAGLNSSFSTYRIPPTWSADKEQLYMGNLQTDDSKQRIQQLLLTEATEQSLDQFVDSFTDLLINASGTGSSRKIIPNKFWTNRDDTLKSLSKSLKYVTRKRRRKPLDRSVLDEYNDLARKYKDQLKKLRKMKSQRV